MKRAPLSLKAQALALLGRREHSRAELRSKLMEHVIKLQRFEAEQRQHVLAGEANATSSQTWRQNPYQGDPFGEDIVAVSEPPPSALETFSRSSSAREQALSPQALQDIEDVLDWLESRRYQSDARFIESRVNSRAGRWGQARIQLELQRHGVELDADTAQHLKETELSRAREVWQRRFNGQAPQDPKEHAKQIRFLASRGFRTDIIRRVIENGDADVSHLGPPET
jgi:regulatory protein